MRTAGAADPASRCGETRADGGGITIHLRVYAPCARSERFPFANAVYSQDTKKARRCTARHAVPVAPVTAVPSSTPTVCNFHSDSHKLHTSCPGTSSRCNACAKLFSRSIASSFLKRAAVGEWSFGLCATRSREPRQARKGATVPGLPWAPQTTRSSSHRQPAFFLAAFRKHLPNNFPAVRRFTKFSCAIRFLDLLPTFLFRNLSAVTRPFLNSTSCANS
jgi:hypothetical protein